VSESGIDRVEFLISSNAGEDVKPLKKVASGGEISRVMLALKSIFAANDSIETLIFDEIDVGIGGRVGATVGRKLWELTASKETGAIRSQETSAHGLNNPEASPEVRHQVLCITHLPQLAGYGDRHFAVRKQVVDQRTRTELVTLAGQPRVSELAAMLGSNSDAGRISAEEILAEVALVKARLG
jgi:DNA repair protein RecN (Recombination protein N)